MKGADYLVRRTNKGPKYSRHTTQSWQTAKPGWTYKAANADITMWFFVGPGFVLLQRFDHVNTAWGNSTLVESGPLKDLWEKFNDYARML